MSKNRPQGRVTGWFSPVKGCHSEAVTDLRVMLKIQFASVFLLVQPRRCGITLTLLSLVTDCPPSFSCPLCWLATPR